jgi:putative PEP-CTERM system histidine kinase
MDDVAFACYAAAALLQGALVVYLLLTRRLRHNRGTATTLFLAGLSAGAAWAGVSAAGEAFGGPGWTALAAALDVLRYGLWLGFLWSLVRLSAGGSAADGAPRRDSLAWLPAASFVAVAAVAVVQLVRGWQGQLDGDPERAFLIALLALPLCGLLLVEQLYRKLGEDARWSAKPVCLALGCVFAFDLYLYSEALLFSRLDADLNSVRGLAQLIAVPLLFMAARRHTDWMRRLQVSRTAAFHSVTLILAGGYLLFMSAVGYYVRYFGGTWGRALQIALLLAGVALLVAVAFSGALRSRLRVFVGKHFFSYRYDYREEWLRFTAALSTQGPAQEVGMQIVRGLARTVECPAGSLWTRAEPSHPFSQTVRWNVPEITTPEPADSAFCRFLRERGWVIDLDEFRSAPRQYGELALPTWLLASQPMWVVVPLLAGDELLGFVLLAPPRTPVPLDWEVRDLLKTAGRQAAGYLAQMQAVEALLESRKFDAFNKMSAFVVHDLKNIVTQLSLMLKNAERLHDNREFQQDMLLTVESSLEKMRRLMLQLREGATPPGGSRGVELAPLVAKLQTLASQQGRTLQVRGIEPLATRGHDERLERVLGHMVQNALDATPRDGEVWIDVRRFSGQVVVEVGDTGAGMSEEFVKTRLFRPFASTKSSGMGIGSYESHQYVRELGGSIEVDSAPGRGTRMTVRLPVFELERGSALLGSPAR